MVTGFLGFLCILATLLFGWAGLGALKGRFDDAGVVQALFVASGVVSAVVAFLNSGISGTHTSPVALAAGLVVCAAAVGGYILGRASGLRVVRAGRRLAA